MINYWSVTAINKEKSIVCEVSREISDLSHSLNKMTLLQFYNSPLHPGICPKKFTFQRGG